MLRATGPESMTFHLEILCIPCLMAGVKRVSEGEDELRRTRDCLVPRRLSFDENVRAKEGGKETTAVPFPWSLAVHHQSLVSRSPLPCEKRSA